MSKTAPQPVIEVLTVGRQAAERVRVVAAADLDAFAAVSGDSNPLHLEEDYLFQDRTFKRTLRVGDEQTILVEVTHVDEAAGRATFSTRRLVKTKAMAEGEATLRLPRPARGAH